MPVPDYNPVREHVRDVQEGSGLWPLPLLRSQRANAARLANDLCFGLEKPCPGMLEPGLPRRRGEPFPSPLTYGW